MKKIIYSVLSLTLGLVLSGSGCNQDAMDPSLDPTFDKGVKIGSVTWATRNVDTPGTFAPTPESPGMFYQWNRNTGWSATDPLISSPSGASWDATTPSGDTWVDDPCPDGWRVPTFAEFEGLIRYKNKWNNAKKGYEFRSVTNTIFMPAVGCRQITNGALDYPTEGYYWAKDENSILSSQAFAFYISSGLLGIAPQSKNFGSSLRCVKK